MPGKRLLYIHRDGWRGGSVVSLLKLVEQLDRNLYEPFVFFYDSASPYVTRFEALGAKVIGLNSGLTYPKNKLEHMRLGNALEHRSEVAAQTYRFFKSIYRLLRRDTARAWRIKQLIIKNRIDLVHHNHWGQENVLGAWLAGVPQVCHMRALGKLGPLDKRLARSVDAFVYVSSALAAYYEAQGIPARQSYTILNGVEAEAFTPDNDTGWLRREFGLKVTDQLIGSVGRLVAWKGCDFFLEAVAALKPDFPHLKAIVVGEADDSPPSRAYQQKLQALTQSLGLADTVIFTGYRADVAQIMAGLDVLVHSAIQLEPGGRVLIEAMMAGVPVVATDTGGILDIAEDGVHALLVPVKDIPAIVAAVKKLLADPSLAQQIAGAARRKILDCCTVKQNAQAIQSVYQHIFNSTNSSELSGVSSDGISQKNR